MPDKLPRFLTAHGACRAGLAWVTHGKFRSLTAAWDASYATQHDLLIPHRHHASVLSLWRQWFALRLIEHLGLTDNDPLYREWRRAAIDHEHPDHFRAEVLHAWRKVKVPDERSFPPE